MLSRSLFQRTSRSGIGQARSNSDVGSKRQLVFRFPYLTQSVARFGLYGAIRKRKNKEGKKTSFHTHTLETFDIE